MTGPGIVRSEFDSEIFAVNFFRVVSDDAAVITQAAKALPDGPLIADAKVAAGDFEAISALGAAGFRKISTLVEFAAEPKAGVMAGDGVARQLVLSEGDLEAHAQGFRFQRFRQDPLIPANRSVELMRRWIANSLAGRREVLAIGRNFCSFAVDRNCLTIDLLSCLDAGQGMAGRLLDAIHAEAVDRRCSELRVTTEAENVAAMRVYLRAGFSPVLSWGAMHLVRGVA